MSYFGGGDYYVKAALGLIPGTSVVNRFGQADNVDLDVVTDLWDGANATDDYDNLEYLAVADASIVSVESTSAADAAAGTGLRTVSVVGLNTSWLEVSETVAMAGAVPVTSTTVFLRVFDVVGLTWGSGQTNAGQLIILDDGGVLTGAMAVIPIGSNNTRMANYTVPAGKTLLVQNYYGGVLKATAGFADVSLRIRKAADVTNAGWAVVHRLPVASTGLRYTRHDFTGGLAIPEKSDIRLTAVGSDDDMSVVGGFCGMLIAN